MASNRESDNENIASSNEDEPPARRARRARAVWTSNMVDDVIDVILNNELFTDRLLRNPGNWGNNEIYEDLTTKFKELHPECTFSANQIRTRVKKCITDANYILKTQQTATGISRVALEKGYTKWFDAIIPVLKERDSNNPETILEPGIERSEEDRATPNSRSGRSRTSTPNTDNDTLISAIHGNQSCMNEVVTSFKAVATALSSYLTNRNPNSDNNQLIALIQQQQQIINQQQQYLANLQPLNLLPGYNQQLTYQQPVNYRLPATNNSLNMIGNVPSVPPTSCSPFPVTGSSNPSTSSGPSTLTANIPNNPSTNEPTTSFHVPMAE